MAGIEERFAALAHTVSIPHPWRLSDYVERVAAHRGRPITLHPVDAGLLAGDGCGTGSGLWIARRDADLIVYGADTTQWHAEHIVVHELGHMLLGHGAEPEPSAPAVPEQTLAAVAELLPSISLESIAQVLGRTDYGTARERDAESFADLVMLRALRPPRRNSLLHKTFFRDGRS
ncbi:hypothetical protein D5S18_01465 [Nocardia panacis]|uniref:ImmA/IrrE family metallo-endopeptidase n=1 Tax=Nocardia panacis TaxID=2340916 RepID=A0A3A4KQG9_9NOCA|nr:hypothetical protein [Nocardia panacis]RJO79953.1 hypothetical protein D5S18_01465 [Nocardia panacis]